MHGGKSQRLHWLLADENRNESAEDVYLVILIQCSRGITLSWVHRYVTEGRARGVLTVSVLHNEGQIQ